MNKSDVLGSRLGRRIVALIIFAGLLPLSLFAIPIYMETREILIGEARTALEGQAELASAQISRTLELAEARLKEAALASSAMNWKAASMPVYPDPFRRMIRLDRDFHSILGDTTNLPWPVLDSERRRALIEGRSIATLPYEIANSVSVSIIVRHPDGGFLAGEIDPIRLWEVTRGTNFGVGDVFRVIDSQKRILASSQPFHPLQLPPGLSPEWQLPGTVRASGVGALSKVNSAVWVVNKIRMDLLPPKEEWSVLLISNANAAAEFKTRVFKDLLLFFLLCLGILTLLSMRSARDILGPISELAETVKAFGDGDMSVRSSCAKKDEIGDLAQSFNLMAAQLKHTYEAQARLEGEAVVGRMASQVAHEVNNPLAAIKTWIGHVRRKLPHDEQNVITRIDEQINRIARTVRSLLHFSKQRELRDTEIPVTSLLEVIATLFDEAFRVRGINFVTDIPENLPGVRGDADKIQEALINLLENSRSLLQSGRTVWLSGHSANLQSDAFLEIVVENDGPDLGENPEILFRPFYTTKTTGTGLGLSLARRICEEHGGTLHGENRSGGGARFVLRFPWLHEAGAGLKSSPAADTMP